MSPLLTRFFICLFLLFFFSHFHVDRYVASTGRSYPLSAGRSAHSSRTSSAASTPILRHRNNHRHQIIRFNTRRLIIFHQRITNQNLRNQQQSSAEIPLVHRDNLLATANNQHAPASAVLPAAHHRKTLSDTPNSAESQNVGNGAAVTMLCLDQDVSETSQTKNTSVMISYLWEGRRRICFALFIWNWSHSVETDDLYRPISNREPSLNSRARRPIIWFQALVVRAQMLQPNNEMSKKGWEMRCIIRIQGNSTSIYHRCVSRKESCHHRGDGELMESLRLASQVNLIVCITVMLSDVYWCPCRIF